MANFLLDWSSVRTAIVCLVAKIWETSSAAQAVVAVPSELLADLLYPPLQRGQGRAASVKIKWKIKCARISKTKIKCAILGFSQNCCILGKSC